MRGSSKLLYVVIALALGCGSSTNGNPPPADVPAGDAPAIDAPSDDTPSADAPRTDAPRSDATGDRPRSDGGCPVDPTPTGTSRASAMCTEDSQCGGGSLGCDDGIAGGACTAECVNSTSQPCERAQCGGNGATCLTIGDGPDSASFCAASCNPTARAGNPGSCRSGTVCTGWWYTHEGATPDATGCEYFCTSDATCPMGQRCNVRTGECGDAAADTTRRADGQPCDPSMESGDPPMNTQCRGICFQETDDPHQGICGSLVNLAATPECPDNPTHIHALAPSDDNGRVDNLGLCIYVEDCTSDADCAAPLRCTPGEDGEPSYCTYDDGTLPPPTDGGVRLDAASDGGPSDAAVDSGPRDASADGAG